MIQQGALSKLLKEKLLGAPCGESPKVLGIEVRGVYRGKCAECIFIIPKMSESRRDTVLSYGDDPHGSELAKLGCLQGRPQGEAFPKKGGRDLIQRTGEKEKKL